MNPPGANVQSARVFYRLRVRWETITVVLNGITMLALIIMLLVALVLIRLNAVDTQKAVAEDLDRQREIMATLELLARQNMHTLAFVRCIVMIPQSQRTPDALKRCEQL